MRENISNPKNYTKLYMLNEYCIQHFAIYRSFVHLILDSQVYLSLSQNIMELRLSFCTVTTINKCHGSAFYAILLTYAIRINISLIQKICHKEYLYTIHL